MSGEIEGLAWCADAPFLPSDSDDEDDTAALMAELARIKQERAEEKARLVSQESRRKTWAWVQFMSVHSLARRDQQS